VATPAPPTKVVGRRVAAFILDGIVAFGPGIVVFVMIGEHSQTPAGYFGVSMNMTIGGSSMVWLTDVWTLTGAAANIFNVAVLVYLLAYLVVLPGLTGRTAGKLLTGVKLVGRDGRPPGIGRSFLRELLWIVDDFPYLIPGLTGFIVAMSSATNQRVGDMVASTWVIRADTDAFQPPPAQPPPEFTQQGAPPPA
jgi:uncharacterized RDD family membrane protein YckC